MLTSSAGYVRLRLAGALLAVWSAALPSSAASLGDTATVQVANGSLRGAVAGGIASYEGIPYAAPPVGNLRWRAPEAPASWTGERDAENFGASCEQAGPPRHVPYGSGAQAMSEDCLTLNVWAPVSHAAPLPVMVWLHGGANVSGTGADRYYDGSAFARDGVVLVTLNYRLGLLGFFAHPALAGPAGEQANFGLLDQIAALRWVRANIAAFGGDPRNVTLFGESAGAADTVVLASSQAAKGLFARAISESAGGLWSGFLTLAQARVEGARIATALGLPGASASAAQLRALSAESLAARADDAIGPVIDGGVIAGPNASAYEGRPRVPMIVGTNDADGSVLGGAADPQKFFGLSHDAIVSIRSGYAAQGIRGDTAVSEKLFGDGFFAAPSRWVAARAVASGQPAYRYRFDYVGSFFQGERTAATHGSEIPFVFESFVQGFLSDTDRAVQTTLHGCWVAFARTGIPTCPAAPAWPAYDPKNARLMIFGAKPAVGDDGDTAVLDILQRELAPR